MVGRKTVPVHIAGLLPKGTGTKNMMVSIWSENRENRVIVGDYADENGEFRAEIPKHFAGKSVFVNARLAGFIPFNQEIPVEGWGLFAAVELRPDDITQISHRPGNWESLVDLVGSRRKVARWTKMAKLSTWYLPAEILLALASVLLGFVHISLAVIAPIVVFVALKAIERRLLRP
jgi:hypothetical protein